MRGLSKARSMEEGITGESLSVFRMVLGWIDKESFCSEGTIKEDSKCWDELDETEVWFGMEGCVVGLDAREGWENNIYGREGERENKFHEEKKIWD